MKTEPEGQQWVHVQKNEPLFSRGSQLIFVQSKWKTPTMRKDCLIESPISKVMRISVIPESRNS